jgi:hypothetical protein
MASDQASSNRNTAKWCLVAVLGVVLMGVVAWQILGTGGKPPSSGAIDSASEKAERTSRRAPRKFPAKSLPLTPTATTPMKWPTIALSQAIKHDPFAPEIPPGTVASLQGAASDEVAQAVEAERAALLAETLQALRERGVAMVLHTADGPVATIGDRMIKVGDKVGDYQVTEIDADGVVLEPTPPK